MHLYPILLFVLLKASYSLVNSFEETSRSLSAIYPYQINITLDKWMKLDARSDRNMTLQAMDIPDNVTFLLVQAHSFIEPLTLSSAQNATLTEQVTSTDVGMTSLLRPGETEVMWYLSTRSPKNLTIHVLVTTHDRYDPVPGACNQVFPLEYDPNIHTSDDPSITDVKYQFSNVGFPRVSSSESEPNCEDQWDVLYYDLYIHYTRSANPNPAEHFHAVKRMTRPEDIMTYGTKKVSITRGKGLKPRSPFMAYPSQGSIYNVIVTQIQGKLVRRSAYVPSTTYSCNLHPDHPDSCNTLDDRSHPNKAIATTLACCGFFLMLFAHRFFKCHLFSFGLICGTLLSFILLRISLPAVDPIYNFAIGVAVGVVVGVLWVAHWWYFGKPIVAVMMVGLTSGYLFASIMFYTPLDDFSLLRWDLQYGMLFASWILFYNIMLLPMTKIQRGSEMKMLSIVASSMVGSYSIIFATGLYVKSNIPYILINSIRKAVVPGFIEAIPTKPFGTVDIILVVTWIILFAVSTAFQLYTTRRDPMFPPCPRTESLLDRRRLLLAEESANEDDRQGLLSQISYPSYRTIDAADGSPSRSRSRRSGSFNAIT